MSVPTLTNLCPCDCHGHGIYGACSIEGGCGSVGCINGRIGGEPPEHSCARGSACADRYPERDEAGKPTGLWLPAAITTERGLCGSCTRHVAYALNHLPGDVVELTMLMGRTGVLGEVVVASTPELPIPIRVGVEALRAEIDDELQAWVEPVAEKLVIDWDTTEMQRSRIAPRVQRAAHILSASVDTLLALPEQEHPAWIDGEPLWDHVLGCQDTVIRDGIDAGLLFIELHRRAYAVLGRTTLVHRLPAPCPWCDMPTLVRYNGEDHVECETCRKHIEERHYHWFVAVLVREQERLGMPA